MLKWITWTSLELPHLRCQSLYLKFYPLLKDSPLRPVPVIPVTHSTQDGDDLTPENMLEDKLVELDF